MAYLDTRRGPSFGSMAAVVAIHGAVGAALILGLSVAGVIDKDEVLVGINIKPTETPPPPEPPEPQTQATTAPDRKIVAPEPPIPIPPSTPSFDIAKDVYPPLPPLPPVGGDGLGRELPKPPTPSFTAVGAKPRNDPNRWVTTEDYRGNWIRREMTGRARFRLEILADGRVADCTITASSGHPELDAATCALVSKRARFQPARGGEGEAVAGSYTSAIDWRLPD